MFGESHEFFSQFRILFYEFCKFQAQKFCFFAEKVCAFKRQKSLFVLLSPSHVSLPSLSCTVQKFFILLVEFQAYSAIGIRIVPVAMEIMNNGPTFVREHPITGGNAEIGLFNRHFKKIREEVPLNRLSFDVGMFMRQE